MNDPAEYQGLSHFLEHMLFMGTTKYPDESEYSEYMSANGGYDNAYTSEEVIGLGLRILGFRDPKDP